MGARAVFPPPLMNLAFPLHMLQRDSLCIRITIGEHAPLQSCMAIAGSASLFMCLLRKRANELG